MRAEITILEPEVALSFHSVGRRLVCLDETDWLVFIHKDKTYRLLLVEGTIIDGASIPRLTWTLLGLAPHGVMDTPALPHDLIYKYKGVMPVGEFQVLNDSTLEWENYDESITRAFGDALLFAMCVHFDIERWRATLVWSGVRVGGWWPWMRDDHKRMEKVLVKQGVAA